MKNVVNTKTVWSVNSDADRDDFERVSEHIYDEIKTRLDDVYAYWMDSCRTEKSSLMLADWFADILERFGDDEGAQAIRDQADDCYDPTEDPINCASESRLAAADF